MERYGGPSSPSVSGERTNHGGSLSIRKRDCVFIRALDAQRPHGKTIFGSGLLLNTQAAAARQKAQTEAAQRATVESGKPETATCWSLSDKERRWIEQMDKSNGTV